ncbi:MAG: hypothetical protein ABI693_29765, partial [Bryobacteraceae bacterium]
LLATAGLCQSPPESPTLPPEVLLLARIKEKMRENLSGLPNYTCTQIIERSQRLKPSKRWQLVDTVRLEVALAGGKELFAWPGERKFEERELSEMVTGGAIGNGNFALHAKAVFTGGGALFTYAGKEVREGRNTIRFEYRVPRLSSGLGLRVGVQTGIAAYHGSFWVDAQTLDLIRLEVIATEIPANVPISSTSDSMEYGRVRIGDSDYLLPSASEMVMLDLLGNESRNRVQLSSCRQYSGESTLVFDDPPSGNAPTPVVTTEFDVPAALDLEVYIEKAPALSEAVIGDQFFGKVARDCKQKKDIVIPKNAAVTGRISYLELDRVTGAMLVGFELTEIEFPGKRGAVKAHLMEAGTFGVLENWRLAPNQSLATRARSHLPGARNVFVVIGGSGARGRLNIRTVWRTEAVAKETQ